MENSKDNSASNDRLPDEIKSLKDNLIKSKSSFTLTLIIVLICFIVFNTGFCVLAWTLMQKTYRDLMLEYKQEVLASVESKVTDELKQEITDDVLKEYAKDNYLPSDYETPAMYIGKHCTPYVLEFVGAFENQTYGINATCIVINAEGYVLTNAHAVTYKTTETSGDVTNPQITVRHTPYDVFYATEKDNDEKLYMTLIDYDIDSDLAVLKINDGFSGRVLPAFGNSELIRLGEDMAILGNSLGMGIMLSTGVVSGMISYNDIDYIQTNTIILKGNSGSAAFNLYGDLIGMVSFEISSADERSASSIGFIISVNELKSYIQKVAAEKSLSIDYALSEYLPNAMKK